MVFVIIFAVSVGVMDVVLLWRRIALDVATHFGHYYSRSELRLNLSSRKLLQNTTVARANSELTGQGGRNNAKDI